MLHGIRAFGFKGPLFFSFSVERETGIRCPFGPTFDFLRGASVFPAIPWRPVVIFSVSGSHAPFEGSDLLVMRGCMEERGAFGETPVLVLRLPHGFWPIPSSKSIVKLIGFLFCCDWAGSKSFIPNTCLSFLRLGISFLEALCKVNLCPVLSFDWNDFW